MRRHALILPGFIPVECTTPPDMSWRRCALLIFISVIQACRIRHQSA
ncbi:hypothetical protein OHAE_3197 [Ochrobactrum soli]|uniref:Uncharacterized protein n=1 Tax=Ochrobactrum soli TaxID=2448455 RepID=A0A2P9HGM4_9HYPH|nr:hypothetical protein OHAE_3197 [[Ochrobactrum] soli]